MRAPPIRPAGPALLSSLLALLTVLAAPVVIGAPAARAAGGEPDSSPAIAIEVDPESGEVRLTADAEVVEVLAALRERTELNLIYDARLRERIELEVDGVTPVEAVRRVAAAAGLVVEEEPGPILLVRRPHPAEDVRIVASDDGVLRARDRFDYPVRVVGEGPDDAEARRTFSRLEVTPGISLTVAQDVRDRILVEYARHRAVYRRMVERAGEDLVLRRGVDDRSVRVYVSTGDGLYLAEVLFEEPTGAGLVRLVYVLEGKGDRRILELFIIGEPLE